MHHDGAASPTGATKNDALDYFEMKCYVFVLCGVLLHKKESRLLAKKLGGELFFDIFCQLKLLATLLKLLTFLVEILLAKHMTIYISIA